MKVFAEIERKQLEFLDEAAKRIIELVTALLGLLFAIIAFGNTFPPPYLTGTIWAKAFSIAALVCYLLALLFSLWVLQPRRYQSYPYNLTAMQQEFERMIAAKAHPMRWASLLFGLGSVFLGVLIVIIIWRA